MPSVVLGRRVAVAVRTERRDPPLGEERGGGRVQARLGARRVPRIQLGAAESMAGADEEDVALGHRHALLALGRLEVLAEDVLAGLEPGHPAQPGHVEQHAAADQAVLDDLDRVDRRALRGDGGARLAVVEGAVEGDVAERVDMAVAVVVIVDADVVLGEAERSGPDVDIARASSSGEQPAPGCRCALRCSREGSASWSPRSEQAARRPRRDRR